MHVMCVFSCFARDEICAKVGVGLDMKRGFLWEFLYQV